MRMRPKTSDRPAASRNSSIPKESPLRVCTIQKSIATSPPLFAKVPLSATSLGLLIYASGAIPRNWSTPGMVSTTTGTIWSPTLSILVIITSVMMF